MERPASDVWALGCVLYELCNDGAHAFEGKSLPALVMNILKGRFTPLSRARFGRDVRELQTSLLALEPGRRPSVDDALRSPAARACLTRLATRGASATRARGDDGGVVADAEPGCSPGSSLREEARRVLEELGTPATAPEARPSVRAEPPPAAAARQRWDDGRRRRAPRGAKDVDSPAAPLAVAARRRAALALRAKRESDLRAAMEAQARPVRWSPRDRVRTANAVPRGLSRPACLSAHPFLATPARDAFQLRF